MNTKFKILGTVLILTYLPLIIKSRKGVWKYIALAGIYLRKAITSLTLLSGLSLFTVLSFFIKPKEKTNTYWCKTFGPICMWLLNVTVDIENLDNLKKHIPCIIVANHQSMADSIILSSVVSNVPKIVFVAKKSLLWMPVFGLYSLVSGNIFIDRSNRASCIEKLHKLEERMKRESISLIVFPEGTRNPGCGLLPFKKGAFHVAVNTKLPIIPVVVENYTKKIENATKYPWSRHVVKIRILEAVKSEGANVSELTERVYNMMLKNLEELNEKC